MEMKKLFLFASSLFLLLNLTGIAFAKSPGSMVPLKQPPPADASASQLFKKPALKIISMKPTQELHNGNPMDLQHGIKISIWNGGNAPSGDFEVRFHCIGCPPSALGTKTKVFTSLAPQQVHQFVYPDPSSDTWKTGQYTLEVVVDPEMKIPDDFRGDNSRTLPFQVLP